MATLNAIVIKSKEGKNGKNKVRISVAHNGETRYIVTDIVLASSKEFKTEPSSSARMRQCSTPKSASCYNTTSPFSMISSTSTDLLARN